jgi:hypothetical protein
MIYTSASNQPFWLGSLVNKIFVLLFVFQVIVFFYFVIGNFQEFVDSTQLTLLRIQKVSGIFFIMYAVYSILMQIFTGAAKRGFSAVRFILTIVGFIVGAGMVIIVYFFLTIVTPVGME